MPNIPLFRASAALSDTQVLVRVPQRRVYGRRVLSDGSSGDRTHFFLCLPESIFGSHAAPGRPREAEKLENMKILMFGENGPRVVLMKGRPYARVNSP